MCTLFFVVFVDFVQISFLWPLLPKIVSETFHRGVFEIGLLGSAAAFGEAVGAPWLGNFADIYGRRVVLVVSGLGCCLSSVAVALAPTYEMLLAARLFTGLCGSSVGVAMAYVADSTTAEERPRYINYCMAALFLGLAFGPLGGAYLEQLWDYRLACYSAGVLCLVNVLMVALILPDSTKADVAEEKRTTRAICINCIFPCSGLPFQAYLIGAASFFGGAGFAAFEALGVLFCSDTMFDGDVDAGTRYYGLLISAVGIMGLFGTLFLYEFILERLKKCLTRYDLALKATIVLGGGAGLLCFFLMGSTMSQVSFGVAVLFMVLGDNISGPSIQTMVTLVVEDNQFGKAMGMMTLCGNIARAFGPFIVAPIYDLGGQEHGWVFWHSAPWFLNAGFKFMSLVCVLIVRLKLKELHTEDKEACVEEEDIAKVRRADTWAPSEPVATHGDSPVLRRASSDRASLVIRGQTLSIKPVLLQDELLGPAGLNASLQPLQAPSTAAMA